MSKPAVKKTVARPVSKPAAKKPVARAVSKPAVKKTVARPVSKLAVKKTVTRPVSKPAVKKPVVRAVSKPAAKKTVARAVSTPAAKKSTARPMTKKEKKEMKEMSSAAKSEFKRKIEKPKESEKPKNSITFKEGTKIVVDNFSMRIKESFTSKNKLSEEQREQLVGALISVGQKDTGLIGGSLKVVDDVMGKYKALKKAGGAVREIREFVKLAAEYRKETDPAKKTNMASRLGIKQMDAINLFAESTPFPGKIITALTSIGKILINMVTLKLNEIHWTNMVATAPVPNNLDHEKYQKLGMKLMAGGANAKEIGEVFDALDKLDAI